MSPPRGDALKFHGVPPETAHANYTIKRGALYGIISAERILYHAHVASPRRRAEISWRAVADGTCQLYHKARSALWYNKSKTSENACFGYGNWPPSAAGQGKDDRAFPVIHPDPYPEGQSRDRCRGQGEGAALRRRVGAEGCPSGRRAATFSTSGQVADAQDDSMTVILRP